MPRRVVSIRPHLNFTIEQIREGDQDAVTALCHELNGVALRVINTVSSDFTEEDKEDLASEALVKVATNYLQVAESIEAFKAITAQVARNHARDFLDRIQAEKRGGKNKPLSLDQLQEDEDFEPSADCVALDGFFGSLALRKAPDVIAQRAEVVAIVEQALSQISDKYAGVVRNFYFYGMKEHEIAKTMGLKLGSIGVYKDRGLRQLEVILQEKGLL